jgi:hypothetical protein
METLKAIPYGSVVAPAGCGKTQAIVTLVETPVVKPPLILTHTNAGVAALQDRLRRAGITASAYRLSTIDAWSQHVVYSFPKRAGYDLDPLAPIDYGRIREAVLCVACSGALEKPLKATYSGVLVDEYQDCDFQQHALIWELSRHLPTRVFGDPMQAIFDFDGPIVPWSDVERAFPPLDRLSTPWRWNCVGCEQLGDWLYTARESLERGEALDLSSAPPEHVRWVPRNRRNPMASDTAALRSLTLLPNERLLIIGHTSTAAVRHDFARRTGGVSIVERADLPDLVNVAVKLAASAPGKCLDIGLSFTEMVMTKTELPQMRQRLSMLRSGRGRKAAEPHEQAALDFLAHPSPQRLRLTLLAMADKKGARIFRRELFNAMLETLSAARDFSELHRRAVAVRDQRRFGARRLPRRALGTTVLLKGLEADHALILDADQLDARHLYVAITRGARSLTVTSSNPVINC